MVSPQVNWIGSSVEEILGHEALAVCIRSAVAPWACCEAIVFEMLNLACGHVIPK
jgi:hypothetical protein